MIVPLLGIALGQLCAIGIHAFTWWLRRKALWLSAVLGLLGLVGVAYLVVFLLLVILNADFLNVDSLKTYDPIQYPSTAQILGINLGVLVCAVVIGLLHTGQLRSRWSERRRIWIAATLSVYSEILLTFGLWLVLGVLHYSGSRGGYAFRLWITTSLWLTLLALMLFRPSLLKFLRLIVLMMHPEGEHSSVARLS